MYRLKEDYSEEIQIKKSRFICYLHRCKSEADAKDYILKLKKEHPNANHHCYAFLLGEHNEIQRSNDDGEPSGTAGSPMLDCLSKQHMQDIIAVTVRYFGGIKLGGGGLMRAYSKSVSNALEHATLTRKQTNHQYLFKFSYELIGKLDYYFREHNITILQKEYGELVQVEYLCIEPIDDALLELTNGLYQPTFVKDIIVDIPINKKQS